MYIATNLQDNPKLPGCARATISSIRSEATAQVLRVCLDSSAGSPLVHKLLQRDLSKAEPKTAIKTPKDILSDAYKDFLKRSQEEYGKAMKAQLQRAIQQQLKQQEELASLWRELMKIDDVILIRKMSNPDPVISTTAIQVAAKKRLSVEKQCIGLLNNNNAGVRQAARQTLIRLGRGVDFGADPSANPQQIAISVRSWSQWADIQTEEPPEESEAPCP